MLGRHLAVAVHLDDDVAASRKRLLVAEDHGAADALVSRRLEGDDAAIAALRRGIERAVGAAVVDDDDVVDEGGHSPDDAGKERFFVVGGDDNADAAIFVQFCFRSGMSSERDHVRRDSGENRDVARTSQMSGVQRRRAQCPAHTIAEAGIILLARLTPRDEGRHLTEQITRIAETVAAFDAQGWHRTGTDVDAASGKWLAAQIEALGLPTSTEPYELARIVVERASIRDRWPHH